MDKDTLLRIKEKVHALPLEPGVYIMLDKDGNIIYIGKAKALKNRVSSYFINTAHTPKVSRMVADVYDFRYIVCKTELEALNLEANLIKDNQPFYNIMLKDGKAQPFFRIDFKKEFPSIDIVRKLKKDGAKYYGPFFGVVNATSLYKLIHSVFMIRNCKEKFTSKKHLKRECLEYHIGNCLAPCTGRVSSLEYKREVNKVADFLNGDMKEAKAILQRKMLLCSQMEQYEKAIEYRDYLKMLDHLSEKIVTEFTNTTNIDAFSYYTNGITSVVSVVIVRGGKVLGVNNYDIVDASILDKDMLTTFITQYYSGNATAPKEVVVPFEDGDQVLSDWLNKDSESKIVVTFARKGIKKKLLEMCERNAKEYMEKGTAKEKQFELRTMGAMKRLQEKLGLSRLPRRIEGYDISNISGTNIVSSMVVFENGQKSAKNYRKFKIKTVNQSNDFECMKETLTRRLSELNGTDHSFSKVPDLILIDGGKGQLGYAYSVLCSMGMEDKIDIVSLAKRDEEIYKPNNSIPVCLSKDDYALKLLQNVRDESHRFAITFHRALRGKKAIESELTKIDKIGKKKAIDILEHFRTIDSVRNASVEELMEAPGVSEVIAKRIYNYYHK